MRVDLDEVERRLERAVDKDNPSLGAEMLLIHTHLPFMIAELRLLRQLPRRWPLSTQCVCCGEQIVEKLGATHADNCPVKQLEKME